MNQRDSLLDVLKTLFKWKRLIIYTCIAGAVISVGAALMMPNYYQSTAVFYAANPELRNPENFFGEYKRMWYFGGRNEIDRILSVAKSSEMIDFVVDSFDLYQHYRIRRGRPESRVKVHKRFQKLYKIQKNTEGAIELSVEDRDPAMAADLATALVQRIDELSKAVVAEMQASIIATYAEDMKKREGELRLLTDSLMAMREKYGIYDIVTLSELLPSLVLQTETELSFKQAKLTKLLETPGAERDSIIYLSASVDGLQNKLLALTDEELSGTFNLTRFNRGVEDVRILETRQRQLANMFYAIKERHDQFKAASSTDVESIIVVEPPQLPEVKSRPRRSILVLSAMMVVFIFSIVGVLLIDNYKSVNWKEIIMN